MAESSNLDQVHEIPSWEEISMSKGQQSKLERRDSQLKWVVEHYLEEYGINLLDRDSILYDKGKKIIKQEVTVMRNGQKRTSLIESFELRDPRSILEIFEELRKKYPKELKDGARYSRTTPIYEEYLECLIGIITYVIIPEAWESLTGGFTRRGVKQEYSERTVQLRNSQLRDLMRRFMGLGVFLNQVYHLSPEDRVDLYKRAIIDWEEKSSHSRSSYLSVLSVLVSSSGKISRSERIFIDDSLKKEPISKTRVLPQEEIGKLDDALADGSVDWRIKPVLKLITNGLEGLRTGDYALTLVVRPTWKDFTDEKEDVVFHSETIIDSDKIDQHSVELVPEVVHVEEPLPASDDFSPLKFAEEYRTANLTGFTPHILDLKTGLWTINDINSKDRTLRTYNVSRETLDYIEKLMRDNNVLQQDTARVVTPLFPCVTKMSDDVPAQFYKNTGSLSTAVKKALGFNISDLRRTSAQKWSTPGELAVLAAKQGHSIRTHLKNYQEYTDELLDLEIPEEYAEN